MSKRTQKLCSLFLIIVMLVNVLPIQAWAAQDTTEADLTPETLDTTEINTSTKANIIAENIEKRTEYSKEYQLSNGLRLAMVYADPIHYNTENGWEEIDNTLTLKTDGSYGNTAGVWDVRLPQELSQNKPVTISKDGYTLSFRLTGELCNSGDLVTASIQEVENERTAITTARTSAATIQQIDQSALRASVKYPETVSGKLQSGLLYTNVFQNTSVRYDLDSNRVKESIIIDSYRAALRGYRYALNVGDMVPVLEEDGQITLYAPDRKTVVMVMPAPYLVDANEEFNDDIQVQLTGSGSTYTLSYFLPTQWLAAEERQWPVILDPVVSASKLKANIQDVTVSEGKTYSHKWGMIQCGFSETYGLSRCYIKYNELPALTSSDVVLGATLSLYKHNDNTALIQINAHKVNTTWTDEGMVWNTKPSYNAAVEDFIIVDDEGYHTWQITDVVRDWYAKENTGIMFKVADKHENSTTSNFRQFRSVDYGYNRPTLEVLFCNNNGLEDYWEYSSVSAGRAGSGYVNTYTGNMVWVREDIGFAGNRMPVSIKHVYNLNDATVPSDSNNSNDTGGNFFGMGNGWRSNFSQRLYQWDVDSNYYIWEDADGTDHYFKSNNGVLKDEEGLELTLTTSGSGTKKYCITDKYGGKSYFDTNGRLTRQENKQKTVSAIDITYTTSTGPLISTIKDGAGRQYKFTYSSGLLSRISYVGSGTTELAYVTFTYSSSNLTKITDKDGKSCTYTYSGKRLTSAKDINNYKIAYAYNTPSQTWQPYRVQKVSEYDGSTLGGHVTFSYSHNETTLKDHNGKKEIMQFNNMGNLICIQDSEGRAQYTKYAKNDSDGSGKANQLTLQSKMQNTVGNRLKDSSFETGSLSWTTDDSPDVCSIVTNQAYIGQKSLRLKTSANCALTPGNFTIKPGETYTFSAYVKKISGNASLKILKVGTTGNSTSISATDTGWHRYQVSLQNNQSSNITACVQLVTQGAAEVYMDCVQLEKAATASRYNLINNGDFTHGEYGWTRGKYFESTEKAQTVSPSAAPQLDNNVYRIIPLPEKGKHLYQTVQISGKAGDNFVLSGWAKADSVPFESFNGHDRRFGLMIGFYYADGTTETVIFSYNTDADSTNNWQYGAWNAVAKKDYTKVNVDLQYDCNANTAYFDGIQLFREEFGSSYTYDSKGNVVSVTDLQKQTTKYEYNTTNDLTKVIQNNKTKLTYTYDGYHNVKTATTEEGIVYNFTYDAYGNNTAVSVSGTDGTITTSATYTSDGNRMATATDATGKVTKYQYNANTNVLEWVQYPEDTTATRTNYTYDNMYRLATAATTTDTGNALSATYTYTNDRLTKVQTASTAYTFGYGAFGQQSNVKIGGRTLASYSYTQDKNRYLSALDYGNGDKIQYTYDNLGRMTKKTYEDGATVTYQYDNDGALATVTDSETGITTTHYYDFVDRLASYAETGTGLSHQVGYSYDLQNNLTALKETINGTAYTTTYAYDDDNRITSVTGGNAVKTYTYDTLGRSGQQQTKTGGTTVKTDSFTFSPNGTKTTLQIGQHTVTAPGLTKTYSYTYDGNGNILSVSDGTNTTSYVYDSANQLVRENNQAGNFTYTWIYDNAGNILSRQEYAYTTGALGEATDTVAYTYGDSDWGDLLTAYDGNAITHDGIGNPLTDGTWTYTWKHGRELSAMTDGTVIWQYLYNQDGLRTRRTNGTSTYQYVYNGSSLSQMTVGENTLVFFYDAAGTPMSVLYNGTAYFYITNLQGDVTGLLDAAGQPVVAYNYDAWGNSLSITGTMASTLGQLNPLRYRSYVYDEETGLYYLQSRYYDPEVGRFLNADAFASTGQGFLGNNMFAYCNNNSVSFSDSTGSRCVAANPLAGGSVYNQADAIIVRNKKTIKSAAKQYNVDANVLASCIYVEQYYNYDWIDDVTDVSLFFLDTSVGVAQVKVSTATLLIQNSYLQSPENGQTKPLQIAKKLRYDNAYNIQCAAAYLSYLEAYWDKEYDVSTDPAIWGTLYNMGPRTPHGKPQPNWFGKKVGGYYRHMELLLK